MMKQSENTTASKSSKGGGNNMNTKLNSNLFSRTMPGRNIATVLRPMSLLIMAIVLTVGSILSIIFVNYTSLNLIISMIFLCVAFWIMYPMSSKGYISETPFKILIVGYIVEFVVLTAGAIIVAFVALPKFLESSLFNLTITEFGLSAEILPLFIILSSTTIWISPFMLASLFSILGCYKNPAKRVKLLKTSSILMAVLGVLLIVACIADLFLISDFVSKFEGKGIVLNFDDPSHPVYDFFLAYKNNMFMNIISTGLLVAGCFYWTKCMLNINDACQYTSVLNISKSQE